MVGSDPITAVTIAFNAQSTAPPTIRPIPLPNAPGCACSPDAIDTMVRIRDAAPAAISTIPAPQHTKGRHTD